MQCTKKYRGTQEVLVGFLFVSKVVKQLVMYNTQGATGGLYRLNISKLMINM